MGEPDHPVMATFVAGALGALYPHARLVTGVEDDPDEPGAVRVYVGPRYLNTWVLAAPDSADEARRAWATTHHTHLFVVLPDGTVIYQEEGGRG